MSGKRHAVRIAAMACVRWPTPQAAGHRVPSTGYAFLTHVVRAGPGSRPLSLVKTVAGLAGYRDAVLLGVLHHVRLNDVGLGLLLLEGREHHELAAGGEHRGVTRSEDDGVTGLEQDAKARLLQLAVPAAFLSDFVDGVGRQYGDGARLDAAGGLEPDAADGLEGDGGGGCDAWDLAVAGGGCTGDGSRGVS